MATVVRSDLAGCEGFRLESSEGLLGWIEETWLNASNEPVAFAIRTVDGREGLLLAEDVDAVTRDFELVTMRGEARLLELDFPRVETASSNGLSASYTFTPADTYVRTNIQTPQTLIYLNPVIRSDSDNDQPAMPPVETDGLLTWAVRIGLFVVCGALVWLLIL